MMLIAGVFLALVPFLAVWRWACVTPDIGWRFHVKALVFSVIAGTLSPTGAIMVAAELGRMI